MFRLNLINKIFETEIMHGTTIKYVGTGTRTNKVKKTVQELELEP